MSNYNKMSAKYYSTPTLVVNTTFFCYLIKKKKEICFCSHIYTHTLYTLLTHKWHKISSGYFYAVVKQFHATLFLCRTLYGIGTFSVVVVVFFISVLCWLYCQCTGWVLIFTQLASECTIVKLYSGKQGDDI